MRIIIFAHPAFLGSSSMPKYVNMISNGLRSRNHEVETWTPEEFCYKMPLSDKFKKYLGYLDQYLVFPLQVRARLRKSTSNTLFVFADHALGPWLPLIAPRPHVIHCHDFLAQRSAKGEITENRVKLPGRIYQAYIRRGYQKAKNFIAISYKTQKDLHRFLKMEPEISRVVYNGLNQDFRKGNKEVSRFKLGKDLRRDLSQGFLLHVGGNQFYKNRKGVIRIYEAWRRLSSKTFPLVMVGAKPDPELERLKNNSEFGSDILFAIGISDALLQAAYQGASVLIYPSLEEGFGWPVAEAMASGCLVITTNKAPMNEVGGQSCLYIERFNSEKKSLEEWAVESAQVVNRLLELPRAERERLVASGIENAKRFNTEAALDQIEAIYTEILHSYNDR